MRKLRKKRIKTILTWKTEQTAKEFKQDLVRSVVISRIEINTTQSQLRAYISTVK